MIGETDRRSQDPGRRQAVLPEGGREVAEPHGWSAHADLVLAGRRRIDQQHLSAGVLVHLDQGAELEQTIEPAVEVERQAPGVRGREDGSAGGHDLAAGAEGLGQVEQYVVQRIDQQVVPLVEVVEAPDLPIELMNRNAGVLADEGAHRTVGPSSLPVLRMLRPGQEVREPERTGSRPLGRFEMSMIRRP